MRAYRQLSVATLAVASLCITGCASIVRKPEVDVVKKVAIVSLYANQDLYKLADNKSIGGGFSFLKKAVDGKDQDNSDQDNRVRLAKFAYDEFVANLGKVPGWEIVPADKIVGNGFYQAMGKTKTGSNALGAVGDFATRMHQASFATPPKMWAIPSDSDQWDNRRATEMTELCKKLGVDAVAVVHMDWAYESSFALVGTGTAKASVAASTKVWTRDGKFGVYFPDRKPHQSGDRFQSDRSMAMVSGKIFMTADNEVAYQEAIRKSARWTRDTIAEGLKK